MAFIIDPVQFDKQSIDPETKQFNEALIAELTPVPDMWSMPASVVRQNRMKGKGPFPIEPPEKTAAQFVVKGKGGDIPVRWLKPKSGSAAGTYLHIHGGGWVLGSCDAQDTRLQEIADNCQLDCISVEYRLAPEHPYPAGPDDCETVALWLLEGKHELNTDFLAIGGESAGAHLSVITLLRLRDRLSTCPFHAANLTAGVYDLGQTASARNWGTKKLILTTRDMQKFASRFVQGAHDLRDPNISPLYANLAGLPPALFSIGTEDLLLDDTLQMATRWHVKNGNAVLDVTPGGCHVFQGFRHLKIAEKSNRIIDNFLNQVRNKRS